MLAIGIMMTKKEKNKEIRFDGSFKKELSE